MRIEVKAEIERLEELFKNHNLSFVTNPGTARDVIEAVERQLGIKFDDDLRDFYSFSNGSDPENWSAVWFGVLTDEEIPCRFVSLDEAMEMWSLFLPYGPQFYEEWSQAGDDPRIKPYLHHRWWFPIAESNGFSTAIYFDADPTEQGKYGQIIAYQHDPDSVYYVAENFLEFFQKSNRLLLGNQEGNFWV